MTTHTGHSGARGRTVAVIPLKPLRRAKSRLRQMLPDTLRRRLVLAMAQDVIAAALAADALDDVYVLTGDPTLAELARQAGAAVLDETRARGLSSGLDRAASALAADGVATLVYLAGDLPAVAPQDIAALASGLNPESGQSVVLAPDRAGQGTNAFAARPPHLLTPFAFGPGSLERHRTQARRKGVAISVLHTPGLAFDVDGPAELQRLVLGQMSPGPATSRLLAALAEAACHPGAEEKVA